MGEAHSERAEHSSEPAPSCSARQERGWQDNLDSPATAVASARWNNVKRSNKSTAPDEHSDGGHRSERTSLPGERARSGMSPSSNDSGRADPPDPGFEQRLLNRVRRGSSSAVDLLFERYVPWLRRRASGRLPQWARSGVATSDLVQDVLHHAFARLKWFESKHVSGLRAYLRRAVENRVQDELRRAIRRLDMACLAPGEEPLRPFEDAAPQYQQLLHDEMWGRYREGLKRLKVRDRRLIVGRAELGYNYEQLAAIERLPSPDATRKALKRAVIRLSAVMPLASGR